MTRASASGAYSSPVTTDPTPFLSTMTGTSASLVAIVGGLLVARYVGLDSAQQGAEQVLNDARDRLRTAQARAAKAADNLVRFDADRFLGDSRVLNAINAGTTDVTELLTQGPPTPLTVEQLRPFLDDVAGEFIEAKAMLETTIPAFHDVAQAELRIYSTWRLFYPAHASHLPLDLNPDVWKRVFLAVRDTRLDAWNQWKKARPDPPKNALRLAVDLASSMADQSLATSYMLPPPITPPAADFTAINVRRRDERRSEQDRTQQQVEDLEGEVRRLEQARAAIVKPDGLLWQGFIILILFSLIGVIAPLWAMSRTPRDLTPHLSWLFWSFSAAFGLLVAYFAFHAWRLTRTKNRHDHRQPAPDEPRVTK